MCFWFDRLYNSWYSVLFFFVYVSSLGFRSVLSFSICQFRSYSLGGIPFLLSNSYYVIPYKKNKVKLLLSLHASGEREGETLAKRERQSSLYLRLIDQPILFPSNAFFSIFYPLASHRLHTERYTEDQGNLEINLCRSLRTLT